MRLRNACNGDGLEHSERSVDKRTSNCVISGMFSGGSVKSSRVCAYRAPICARVQTREASFVRRNGTSLSRLSFCCSPQVSSRIDRNSSEDSA